MAALATCARAWLHLWRQIGLLTTFPISGNISNGFEPSRKPSSSQCASTAQMGSGRESAGSSGPLRPGVGTWPALACKGGRRSGLWRVQSGTPTACVPVRAHDCWFSSERAVKVCFQSTRRAERRIQAPSHTLEGESSPHGPHACAHASI